MRQKLASQRRECVTGDGKDHDQEDGDGGCAFSSKLLVPKQLQDKFDQVLTTSSTSTSISPMFDRNLDQQKEFQQQQEYLPSGTTSSSTGSPTKKSASCPQFVSEEDADKVTNPNANAIKSRRRREQLDRRERRSKLTIVQRSLTLAQGWNNKGLSMAGRATQAEQEEVQYHVDAAAPNANNSVVVGSDVANTNGVTDTATNAEIGGGESTPAAISSSSNNNIYGLWQTALECWDNALEIYRSLLGKYHERVADVQNNRGIALGKLLRFDDALDALGIALEVRQRQRQRRKSSSNRKAIVNDDKKQTANTNTAANADAAATTAAAIVSTLHNIANVHRDAGQPNKALRVLVDAQTMLQSSLQEDSTTAVAADTHRHRHCWHQSARLSTAIGYVYYESELWRDARDAYQEALEVYERLFRSLSKQSKRLGIVANSQDDQEQQLHLLHYQQLIRREVSLLEEDLDELDRRQQARDGSRTRLLQARQQQKQQQQQESRRRYQQLREQKQQRSPQRRLSGTPSQQQQHCSSTARVVVRDEQQQDRTLLDIVSSLRA